MNWFDPVFYLVNNPDVKAAGVNPLEHFLTIGWKEGRDPSRWFDTSFYLEANPDVKAAGINPLVHFLLYGLKEGRAALDGAVAAVDDAISVNEDATTANLARSLLSNDRDPDTSDVIRITGVTQGAKGSVVFNNGGTPTNPADDRLTYRADGAVLDALAAGKSTTDTFSYTVSDGHGSTDTATVRVTINGVNDQVAAVDNAISVNEDATTANLARSLLSNDRDPDTSDVIRITGVTQGAKGSVVFNNGGTPTNPADDTLTYRADGAVLDALAAGESTTDTFSYTVSDGHGSTDTATVRVTINGVNDQVAAVDNAISVNEDATTANLARSLLSNDSDPDTSDVIRITGVTQGAKGSVVFNNGGTPTNPADDTLTYRADGAVLDALAAGESTTDTFSYTVSDGHGSTDTATVRVTINGVNDQVAAVDNAISVNEDATTANLATSLLSNDSDPDTSDVIRITGVTQGAKGSVVFNNGGTPTNPADDTLTYRADGAVLDALAAGKSTTDTFSYTVSDGHGSTDTATVTVTINGVNDQVDLDLNFGSAGDDRNAGPFDNVTPAQLMFGVAATEITDAEDKVNSVAITITAPQGGSVNAGEALGISPDTLALVSSLLGFAVEVSGNGGQSLTISAPSGQFFTAQALETLLENVTYAINQSDFSFNASDRALSVTVTDFSTGATSDTALLTLDMRADVTATAGQNAFTGGNLSDLARGGAEDDVIAGGAGDDALVGGADNDTLTGGGGNDTIIGNDATVVRSGATFNVGGITGAAPNAGESDTAVYSGASTAYVVTRDPSGSYTVADQVAGRDGTDTLWGIETIGFAGGPSLQLTAAIKVFDASGSVLLATYGADQLDQAVAFANGAGGVNIIELDAAAGSFSAGAWPVVISDAVTIKAVNGGPATISAGANSAFVINESAVDLAGDVVRLQGLSINGTGAANTVGIDFRGTYGGSSDGAIEVVGTSVSNFGRVGLLINGGGSGLSVSIGDDTSTLAAETATFSGSGGANPLDNGTGDILLFEFTGDALLRNVAVIGNSASADNGIQISGFQDGVGSANNVLTEIGNVRLENVSVNGTYQKTLVYIQGYNDLTALDFANVNLGALTGTAAGWAALFIDGAAQGGAYVANGTVGGSIDGTLDLTGVTVIGGVFGTTPNFVALGSKQIVVNGTLADDSIVGTSAHEAFIGLAGNDVIATGGGNDLVLYNVGDGQDTVTDNGGFDTLGLINVDATLAPSATAASWTITNTGTTLSVDTDAAGTIDEVAATGFEALAIQLGDGGDTVTLDGNLGAGGAGLFAITVNGGLAGADGADIVDARTLSSATGIVFNGGAGSDRFVSSNAGGTDTFNGGADGVTGDTVDYSAVTGSGVTVNLSASGVNSTGAGNDTLINVENVIGTNQADTFTGSSDNNMFDGRGGAAVDQVAGYTGAGWQIRIDAAGHWVVQNASGDVDELIDIEKVVINGTTYLLVDQQADGGFASVQAAIDAASGGEVILIAPGSYVESKVPAPHSLSAGGLFIDKPNLILQGVRADGTPIDTAAGARDFGATIVSGAQTDFGANHLVAASGATIQGLHLKAGSATDNMLLEIWADGFQVLNSFVDTTRAGDVATTAVTIHINEVAGTQIDSYRIEGNILNKGIYVENATGDAPGTIGTTQFIRGNTFTGDGSYDGSSDRLDAISVRGQEPGIGWQTLPAQVPLIEDNQVTDNAAPFLFRMREKDATLFPSAAEVAAIVDGNFSAGTTWAYVLDGSDPTKVRLALRDHDGPGGVDPFHQFAVANSINTHNLGLDPASDPVFGTLVVPSMQAGDIVRVNSGAGASNPTLLVNDLTIAATATSADLNLTLGSGVAEVTLVDYAPGHGANVDVTGNAAGNTVTGNSGANIIRTFGGDDRLIGSDGSDTLTGGAGADTHVFLSTAEAATGFDTLEGFSASLDKIEISKAGFEGLSGFAPGNTLGADNFAFRQIDGGGNYSSGTSAPMFLLDNISAGAAPSLWYDADGNGAGAVKIAEFDPTGDLTGLDQAHIWLV